MNKAGLDIVKEFEGLRLTAYRCPAGVLTIGYGTTTRAGVGLNVTQGMTITKSEAEWYLDKALKIFEAKIDPLITRPINENELSAFVSLAYNIGPGAFKRSSALRHFNAGDKPRAAKSILLWNKATVNGKRVKLAGLVRRREAERKLFLKPVIKGTPAYLGGKQKAPPKSLWEVFLSLFEGGQKWPHQ